MSKHKNYLSSVRHTYAGPWPKAILSIISLIVFGHLATVLVFDVKLFDLSALMGNFLVALALVALGIFVKRKYPDTQ